VIVWTIVGILLVLIVNIIMFFVAYRWLKQTVEDYLHEKEYEYQKLLEDMEQEKIHMRAYMESLASVYRDYLKRVDTIVERLVDVQWKEFDKDARDIIMLYLKGYNINEIVAKLGVPKETVKFTLMVALGREGDDDA